MSHVTLISESCHTCEWVMSHVWMSPVRNDRVRWVSRVWIRHMSGMLISYVTRMNESCHTYEWVMSHVWMGLVTHISESCHTYEWVISRTNELDWMCIYVPLRLDSLIFETWLHHMCGTIKAHTYVWHDSLIRVRHDSLTCGTWLFHMCDMTPLYMRHDSSIRVTWLGHTCDMTWMRRWIGSAERQSLWGTMCDMTHSYIYDITDSYVWHDSFICAPQMWLWKGNDERQNL